MKCNKVAGEVLNEVENVSGSLFLLFCAIFDV
jgi:hypothetical protein